MRFRKAITIGIPLAVLAVLVTRGFPIGAEGKNSDAASQRSSEALIPDAATEASESDDIEELTATLRDICERRTLPDTHDAWEPNASPIPPKGRELGMSYMMVREAARYGVTLPQSVRLPKSAWDYALFMWEQVDRQLQVVGKQLSRVKDPVVRAKLDAGEYLEIAAPRGRRTSYKKIFRQAQKRGLATMVYARRNGTGADEYVWRAVWVTEKESPESWRLERQARSIRLHRLIDYVSLLSAYRNF